MMQHRLLRDHRCSAWQVCCSEQGIDPAWAVEEILAAERHVKPAVKVKKKNKALVSELSTINDILEKNEKSKLPAAMTKARPPTLERRLEVHAELLKKTMKQLQQMKRREQVIDPKTRDQETRDLIFNCIFLISESVLPQRTSPWMTATYGVPVLQFDDDDVIDTDQLKKFPCFITWRESEQLYGLCQLTTKTGISPWMPIPKQMTKFMELYLDLLHAGYRQCGIEVLQSAIFPSSLGHSFGSSQFSTIQRDGFERIGLKGATIFNARHAVADHLTALEIVPSNPSQAMLADSFAMAMNTGTKYLFGEKNVRELATWGCYNRHGEAGGMRRKAKAIAKYAEIVFHRPRAAAKRSQRPSTASGSAAATKSDAKKSRK